MVINDKSFEFSTMIVKLYISYAKTSLCEPLFKQVLRSATSVGANISEAQNAESKQDFIHKLSISQKEAGETLYWIRLLNETKLIKQKEFEILFIKCVELLKILSSTLITLKSRIRK